MVLQRVRGATLAEQAPDLTPGRRTSNPSASPAHTPPDPVQQARTRQLDPGALHVLADRVTQRACGGGEVGTAQHAWLLERFTLLQPDGPSRADPILLHRDVAPSNVIVGHDGMVTALLDWGCAEWGSPARDLVGLPIRALPDLLSAYRSALGAASSRDDRDGDLTLERDALWYHLYLALARLLKKPSTSEDRNWAAPRSATLLDFLAFTSSTVPEPWPALLRPISLSSRACR